MTSVEPEIINSSKTFKLHLSYSVVVSAPNMFRRFLILPFKRRKSFYLLNKSPIGALFIISEEKIDNYNNWEKTTRNNKSFQISPNGIISVPYNYSDNFVSIFIQRETEPIIVNLEIKKEEKLILEMKIKNNIFVCQ